MLRATCPASKPGDYGELPCTDSMLGQHARASIEATPGMPRACTTKRLHNSMLRYTVQWMSLQQRERQRSASDTVSE